MKDPRPLREDLPKVFAPVAEKRIDPLVKRTFALLEAGQAIELLATGVVEGKIVLENGQVLAVSHPSLKTPAHAR